MERDDSNSNLFVSLADEVEDVRKSVEKLVLKIKERKRSSETILADKLTILCSFLRVLSDKLRGTLKRAYESEKENVIELKKEVANLKLAISDSNLKIKKTREELKESKKNLAVSDNVIKDLKNQRSTQDSLKNQMLHDIRTNKSLLESKTKQIDSQTEKIRGLQEKLSLCEAEISERDNQISELNKQNKQYTSEISQLKSKHKVKEDNWITNIEKLETELVEKGESVDAQLETLRAEKCTQENLIQKLETRLNALESAHVGVLSSFDNAQKISNELTTKVVELEREVDRQREIISVIDEEKKKLEEKGECVNDLNKKLDVLMLEKDEVRNTLRAEKCSHNNLIQEMMTRLNSLQAEHVGVLASFDDAQEVKNVLMTKVVELEKEADRQNEVISDRTDEKMEAIRQLSSSLEHYKSRYNELRKAFVIKNTARCFDFLH